MITKIPPSNNDQAALWRHYEDRTEKSAYRRQFWDRHAQAEVSTH